VIGHLLATLALLCLAAVVAHALLRPLTLQRRRRRG
jgi:hypothetical protein